MSTPTVDVVSDKTNEEISEIMGDELEEDVFVYIHETDRAVFVSKVLGALKSPYKYRADVFLMVFERGFSKEFAESVKVEIAELWEGLSNAAKAEDPVEKTNPKNVSKKRWLKYQLDATDNTIEALQDFIVH